MRKISPLAWTLAVLVLCAACGKQSVKYGDIKVVVENSSMSIIYQTDTLYSHIPVGLVTDQRNLAENLTLLGVSKLGMVIDDYTMSTGKRSHCTSKSVSKTFTFSNGTDKFNLIINVHPDGLAFKYSLKPLDGEKILSEATTYTIPTGTNRWIQQYVADYEGFYTKTTDGKSRGFRNRGKWGYPVLVESAEGHFSMITEADITRDHAGSQLSNQEEESRYSVIYGSEMTTDGLLWESPWRVVITGTLKTIVESTLVNDVSTSAKFRADSWAKPGTVAWIYWANNHGSKDYQIVKDYIDLAAEMGWTYNLIDWEWDEMSNGGSMADAIKYARERGVKLLLWYNSSTSWAGAGAPGPLYRLNSPENREKEYEWLASNGFYGVKIDFFPDDAASTMNYYLDLLESAAEKGIMVNFHGATLPRGWQRTYPNLMTVEAVYGAEWYNNNRTLTPRAAEHNATLPFTRNVVGSMDYTPGTFSDSQNPHITTNAHELALPVLFESGFQMMPDRPSIYREMNEELKEFFTTLPTAWDDIKLISGYPGDHVVLARRKGSVWYVAGINGTEEAKSLSLDLTSLEELGNEMTLFVDGDSDRDIQVLKMSPETAPSELETRPRGGFVAVIK